MERDELLQTLANNVDRLLLRCQTLKQENEALKQGTANLRAEMLKSHSELVDLQNRYKNLQMAHSMIGGDSVRFEAKKQLTKLIQMVDKCLQDLEV